LAAADQPALAITAHFQIDQAAERYSSDCREFEILAVVWQQFELIIEGMTDLLTNQL
jgi:hypothetical protein